MAARKTVTVVFCDMADSTPLGERIDPEVFRNVQQRYYAVLRDALERHGGTVEKFIGDAVMAVFGIPTAHDDDALRAVRAAIDIRTAIFTLNDELQHEHGFRLAIRTGVNTGEVVTGDPSQGHAFVSGEAVATTQRLEAVARAGEILVGDSTYRLVANAVLVEPVEPLALKGKSEAVTAWRLLGVVEGAPPFPRRLDAPMVGRERELQALQGELDSAIRDRACRLATIVGPAGIGKSRLANEVLRLARPEATAFVGRCLAYGEGITYWPLRGIVLSAVGDLTPEAIEGRLAGADDADRIARRIAAAVGTAEASGGSEETFWAVRRLFEHLARERPLIVGLDELQWAEPAFLDLVEYLVGWSADAPILLLCLARPELLDKRPAWPVAVSLRPLSDEEAHRLVDVLADGAELGPDERDRITSAAEGNPLFLEQLLALGTETDAREAIPPSIHALLESRLDALEPEERRVLEHAAVVGREFTRGAVTALAGEETASILLSLVRKELVEPDRSLLPSDDGFRFRHILIRDAAYLGVIKDTRATLHQRYADWLAQFADELDEIVGYHLEQAFRYRQELGRADLELATHAGERLARAGRRAIGRGDSPAAVSLLARAAVLLPDGHADRRETLPVLGSALMRTGDFGRAERVLTESLEAARSSGDTKLELRTVIEREFLRTFTQPEESVEDIVAVADHVIPLLEQLGDDVGLAKAWWLRSELHLNACRWRERAANLERALAHARRAGDASEQSTIAGQIALALYYGPTPVGDATRRCRELLAQQPADRSLEAAITSTLAGLTAMRGDFDEARRLQEAARAIHEELGMRFRIGVRSLIAADIELLAGRPDEAVTILRWGMNSLREMGVTSVTSTLVAFLADALASAGSDAEAIHYATLAQETSAEADILNQVLWRVAKSRATGDTELAREAVALAAPTDCPDLKARAHAAAGDTDAARRAYDAKGNVAAARRLLTHEAASS